ncbi:MAG: sodium:calcium antiporter [Desulfobacteraceae bacterium]|nr:MAG: sodium:calcium antiporter [Desulfobacteraceae bacterium]
MILQITILCLGLALLYLGSELLVNGASTTAIMFAVKPVIVGLTVVSLATSAPELLVSLLAAIKGSEGISLGNILGSNVINIALVLGISSMIKPVLIKKQLIKIDIPYLVAVTLIFWLLCLDNTIDRVDGWVLIVLLLLFLVYGIRNAKDSNGNNLGAEKLSRKDLAKNLGMIILGILMLAKGADWVVQNAILMAQRIGLSQTFIGISVVALGTSLPELATSAVAASKGESDITLGNVVGSNLFNICLVMGVVGIFNPMKFEASLHWFEFPFMVFITLLLSTMAYFYQHTGKKTGIAFVSLFVIYIAVSYIK